MSPLALKPFGKPVNVIMIDYLIFVNNVKSKGDRLVQEYRFIFKRDGIAEKVNPFKQTGMAKELGTNILNGKRLL